MENNQINNQNLDEREFAVLRALVFEHISTGKPVGSRSFVKKYSFSVSPATMRNIMYDLEKMGYLMQPHTSAGRIPTDLGYRFYVDSLLDSYEFVGTNENIIQEDVLRKEIQLDKIFATLAKMLSNVSHYAGIVLTPQLNFTVVKNIELILLDASEVLFVLITRTGMVFNKKVVVSSRLTQDELYQCSSYLSSELCGYSLDEIKKEKFDSLRSDTNNDYKKAMAIDIAQLALTEDNEQEIFINGIENLLRIPEMTNRERIVGFLNLIEDKQLLRTILEMNLNKQGINILIGEEVRLGEVSGCSIVTSAYKIGNAQVGVIGILGPMRMDYEKVVPLVDYTEKVISELLTKMAK